MDVRLPDGTIIQGVPDNISKADLTARLARNGYDVSGLSEAPKPSMGDMLKRELLGSVPVQSAMGALRGAGSIGATGIRMAGIAGLPFGDTASESTTRRKSMDEALQSMGADTSGLAFGAGKLGGEIAGTAGMGSALALPFKGAPAVANALRTGGMSTGLAPATAAQMVGDLALRTGAGATVGGAAAGLVNPEDAKTGAMIGGALPGAMKAAQVTGGGVRKLLAGDGASQEVQALAQRAKQLGIEVPADRLVNSKPLNALAASLNYVPFSGRAGTEKAMQKQLNTALSRTFGQNTDNVTMGLRKASADLGKEFETTLKNGVNFDQQLLQDVSDVYNRAQNELGDDSLKALTSQVNELFKKGASGQIDGQAAYNIKRNLDRLGGLSGRPEAFHANEMKRALMGALDRSLGPAEAAKFAKVRKQYGNMLDLENLAKNGAEGDISIGRLANLKNIGNPDLQELADIAAQFMVTRESPHGALQRLILGGLAAGVGGVPALPMLTAAAGTGRVGNMALNSDVMKSLLIGQPVASQGLLGAAMNAAPQGLYRAAPLLGQ